MWQDPTRVIGESRRGARPFDKSEANDAVAALGAPRGMQGLLEANLNNVYSEKPCPSNSLLPGDVAGASADVGSPQGGTPLAGSANDCELGRGR